MVSVKDGSSVIDLEVLNTSVEQYLSESKIEEAQRAADVLIQYTPPSSPQMTQAVEILRRVGLSGQAQALVERFYRNNPNDWTAFLAALEHRLKILDDEGITLFIASYQVSSVNQMLDLALAVSRVWRNRNALAVYQEALRLASLNLDAKRGEIEMYNRLNEHGRARKAIQQLMKFPLDGVTGEFWCFVAEQASICGAKTVFLVASSTASRLLGETPAGVHPTIMLARAYGRRRDVAAVERTLRGIQFQLITSDWFFSEMLDLAKRHRLFQLELELAKLALELNLSSSLAKKCRETISALDHLSRPSLF